MAVASMPLFFRRFEEELDAEAPKDETVVVVVLASSSIAYAYNYTTSPIFLVRMRSKYIMALTCTLYLNEML